MQVLVPGWGQTKTAGWGLAGASVCCFLISHATHYQLLSFKNSVHTFYDIVHEEIKRAPNSELKSNDFHNAASYYTCCPRRNVSIDLTHL